MIYFSFNRIKRNPVN